MLTFEAFARFNGGGIQPKTVMVLFGLVTLWAIGKDRPLTAGVFGMLSALAWQPGLLFVGAAGLAFSRYLTSWRDKKALKMLVGAVIPLSILLAYYHWRLESTVRPRRNRLVVAIEMRVEAAVIMKRAWL